MKPLISILAVTLAFCSISSVSAASNTEVKTQLLEQDERRPRVLARRN